MAKRIRRRKCKNCKTLYYPDARNLRHQKYCGKPACRKASKSSSQRLWLSKAENENYFRTPENTGRVQEWREVNPGYSNRKSSSKGTALQDVLSSEELKEQRVKATLNSLALQDLLSDQPIVLIGLIAQITGSALQEDIAITARRLRQLGDDIINFKGGGNDKQTPHLARKGP